MKSNEKPQTRKQRRIEKKRMRAMARNHGRMPASLTEALDGDSSLPLDEVAKKYWLKNLQNPLRKIVLPTLRILLSITLHIMYYVKRLLPIQWKAHGFLQWQICFFMKYFVRPEANILILRHFQAESNLLNFVIDNSGDEKVEPVNIYPKMIGDLMVQTFVHHDQGVLMTMRDLKKPDRSKWPIEQSQLSWKNWNPIRIEYGIDRKKFIPPLTSNSIILSKADESDPASLTRYLN